MFEFKKEVLKIIKSAALNNEDRAEWLGSEVAELGLKYAGLDDIPLDSVIILSSLFTFGALHYSELTKHTELEVSKKDECIDVLIDNNLINQDPASGKYQLTKKGSDSCRDIFNNIVIRKRTKLKRDFEHIERLYSKLPQFFS